MARRLGDMLIDDGLITPTQRDEALRLQKTNGGRFGTNLVQLGAIELEALALALSRQRGVPAAQQRHFDAIHPEVVALLPAKLAQKHSAIPLGFTARHPKTVGIAFLDPRKPGAVDEIQRAAGVRVYPVIAPELRIVRYLEKLYGIPRHPRFLHLDGDTNEFERPAQGAAVGDPRSFFDMTRPDLSQPKSPTAILLTDELRVTEAIPPPASAQRSATVAPARAPPPVLEPSSKGSSKPPVVRGTPSQFAKPQLNPPPTVAPAALWPAFPLDATPPVQPIKAPVSAKPASATAKRPEVVPPRREEATEASSRSPTIPGLPSFSEIQEVSSADIVEATAPTEKIEPSIVAPSADPLSTATSADSRPSTPAVSIWSPDWRATQDAQSASRADGGQSQQVHHDLDAALRAPIELGLESEVPSEPSEPAVTQLPEEPEAAADAVEELPEPSTPSADTVEELAEASTPLAAGNGATQPVSTPGAPRPWSAAEAVDAIAVASNRDQIAEAITNYLRSSCGVGLVLIVQHEVAMGWKGFAPGISEEEIDGLAIPLAAPSVLQKAYEEQQAYRGPPSLEKTALDLQLFERLRVAPPQEVIVAPVLIRDRVVNLILGQAEDGGALPDRMPVGLGTLTRSAAAAYVRLIQEAKKRSLI